MNNFIEWLEVRDKSFLDSMILSESNLVHGPVNNSIINKYQMGQILEKMNKQLESSTDAAQIQKLQNIIKIVQDVMNKYEFVSEEDWELFKKDPKYSSLIAPEAYGYVMRSSYLFAGNQGGGSGNYARQTVAIEELCGRRGPGIGFATINLPQITNAGSFLGISSVIWQGGAYNALVWDDKPTAAAYRSGGAAAGGAAAGGTTPAAGGTTPAAAAPPAVSGLPALGPPHIGTGAPAGAAPVPGAPGAGMSPSTGSIRPSGSTKRKAKIVKPPEPEVPDIFGPKDQKGSAVFEKYKKLDMSQSPDRLKQAAGDLFNGSDMIAYYDGNRNAIAVVSIDTQEPIKNNKPPKNKGLPNPEAGRPVIVTPANDQTSGIAQAIMKAWEDSHGGQPINLAALGNPWKGRTKPNGQPIEFSSDVKILNRPLRNGETYPNQYVVSSERTDKTYGAGSEYKVPSRNTEVPTYYNKQLGARVPLDTKGYQGPQMVWNNNLGRYVPYRSQYR
jgi:hypothetical protein